MKTLKDRLMQGFDEAFASKGKSKGLLKAKCPPMNTMGAAVWQGIMLVSNPYKIGIAHLIFMSPENKEVYNLTIRLSKIIDLSKYDKDANTLKNLGIWQH